MEKKILQNKLAEIYFAIVFCRKPHWEVLPNKIQILPNLNPKEAYGPSGRDRTMPGTDPLPHIPWPIFHMPDMTRYKHFYL